MIDVKRSFKKVLREWGHDIYIQRILLNGNHSNKFERVTTRQVGQSGITNSLSTSEALMDYSQNMMPYTILRITLILKRVTEYTKIFL